MLWIFRLMPSFCLTNSIMFASSKDIIIVLRDDLPSDTFAFWNMGGDIMVLCIHFIFWTIILIVIESTSCSACKRCPDKLKKNRLGYNKDLNLDEDVIEEEQRVENAPASEMKVKVKGFRKVYTKRRS
jgi:hypothetical protein